MNCKAVEVKAKAKKPRVVPITADRVACVMHLRDGGVESYFSLARATGLTVKQVDSILFTAQELPRSVLGEPTFIRCRKCGGWLHTVPCQVCCKRRQYPKYAITKHDDDTPEMRAELVCKLRKRGIRDSRDLAAASGLTEDEVLEIPQPREPTTDR